MEMMIDLTVDQIDEITIFNLEDILDRLKYEPSISLKDREKDEKGIKKKIKALELVLAELRNIENT